MLLKLILAFLPWILFGVLAGDNPTQLNISIIVSLVASVAVGYRELLRGFILTWGTFLFFLFCLITVVLMNTQWVLQYLNVMPNIVLASIAWVSLLVGRPFTLQYARLGTPQERWKDPVFIRVNQLLTLMWGLIFLFDLGLNIAKQYQIQLWPYGYSMLSVGSILFGMLFTTRFPKWYRSRGRA